MEVNLCGQTVTQSVAMLRQAVSSHEGGELTLKIDNETVKLNLLSHISRLGLRSRSERRGPFHYLIIKIKGKRNRPDPESRPSEEAGQSLQASRQETTAFPVAHLGQTQTAPTTTPPVQSQQRSQAQAPPRPQRPRRRLVIPPEEQSLPAAQTIAVKPKQDTLDASESLEQEPMYGIEGEPTPSAKSSQQRQTWLIIQSDQIGSREPKLGFDLLIELLNQVDVRRFVGCFLVHRGVRLLDPRYYEGKALQALQRKNLKLIACRQSVDYYQLAEIITVKTAPFSEVLSLSAAYDLLWL